MISSLELARICGVSQGTVDRALHDRRGISPATRSRILEAARKHGYRPHPEVRALMGGRRRTVGAVVPSLGSVFFMDMMTEVKDALSRAGLRLYISPVGDREEFLETLADFEARKMRAAVVVPPEEGIRLPAHLALPVLSLVSPLGGRRAAFLSPDEARTGRDAVDYLAGRGHRRILHLTYSRRAHAILERTRGYRAAMRGLGARACVLAGPQDDALIEAVRRRGATALFCHNDWQAMRVIRLLESRGLGVPGDLSVLGVDNSPTFVAIYSDLTTMQYPLGQVAERAAEWIETGKARRPDAPFRVVERKTVRTL